MQALKKAWATFYSASFERNNSTVKAFDPIPPDTISAVSLDINSSHTTDDISSAIDYELHKLTSPLAQKPSKPAQELAKVSRTPKVLTASKASNTTLSNASGTGFDAQLICQATTYASDCFF